MKIAIKGHASRGKEVIQILESLGGVNICPLKGETVLSYYYIDYDCNNAIHCHDHNYVNKYCKKYTLEEFEKEFPFKVGELCIYNSPICGEMVVKILGLFLKSDNIVYEIDNKYSTRVHSGTYREKHLLKPYKKMKEERNITLTLDKAKEWYNKGGELKEIALQAFTEKELTKIDLPKTWEEFCKKYPIERGEFYITSLSEIRESTCSRNRCLDANKNVCSSQKSAEAHLAMIQLEQLRDCWRQGWKPTEHNTGYCITHYPENYSIMTFCFISFLSFPTIEMAKDFLECFRDLIEKAGDLI